MFLILSLGIVIVFQHTIWKQFSHHDYLALNSFEVVQPSTKTILANVIQLLVHIKQMVAQGIGRCQSGNNNVIRKKRMKEKRRKLDKIWATECRVLIYQIVRKGKKKRILYFAREWIAFFLSGFTRYSLCWSVWEINQW